MTAMKIKDTSAITGAEGVRLLAWREEVQRALRDIELQLRPQVTDEKPPMFHDVCALLEQVDENGAFLVEGLLPEGGVACIAGEPKVAKTWKAAELAVAVACGTDAFGIHRAKRGRVAYLTFEDRALQRRIESLASSRGLAISPGMISIQPRGEFLDITRDSDLARLIASCRMLGPIAMLVLDPLRDAHSADEDSSTAMRDVMRRLRLVSDLLGATVVVVHHTAKLNETTGRRRHGQRLRGSSVVHAALDGLVHVGEVPGGDGRSVFCSRITVETKSGLAAAAFDVELRIEDDEDGAAVRAAYRAFSAGEPAPSASHSDDQLVLAWIVALAAQGVTCSRRKLRERSDRPVPEGRVERAIQSLRLRGEVTLDPRQNVVPRVGQSESSLPHSLPHPTREGISSDSAGARGATRGMPRRAPVGQPP